MADEIVVITTPDVPRKDLVVTVIDSNGNAVNVTGGEVRMQGRSNDLPTITINQTAALTTPASGIVTFQGIGTYITQAQLTAAGIAEATFRLRLKYKDSAGKTDYANIFELKWVKDPTVLSP